MSTNRVLSSWETHYSLIVKLEREIAPEYRKKY